MATTKRTARHAGKEKHADAELKRLKPGFSTEEARELIGMSNVANYLGPVVFEPFPPGLVPADDPNDPLPNDDGKTYPYPVMPMWPHGWTPGVPSDDEDKPWQNSVLTSTLTNGLGLDGVIVSYNHERDAYAIAFAGTLNSGASMQDMCAILIPAGPVNLGYFVSNENYVTAFPDTPVPPAGGLIANPDPEPPEQLPRVHLGYRDALETMTVGPMLPANLKTILEGIEGDEIDLYVTGHSLGAAVAQLCSAWIRAGGVPSKKINVKCYSFATPKNSNPPMASNYDLALSNGGFSYNVNNSLDTAQQLPPTVDATADLINPVMASELAADCDPDGPYSSSPLAPLVKMILGMGSPPAESAPPTSTTPAAPAPAPAPAAAEPLPFPLSMVREIAKAVVCTLDAAVTHAAAPISALDTTAPAASAPAATAAPTDSSTSSEPPPFPMNFVSMGTPRALLAQSPVVYNGVNYPPEFFPGLPPEDGVAIPDETTRQWWQHWPYNYAKYLGLPPANAE